MVFTTAILPHSLKLKMWSAAAFGKGKEHACDGEGFSRKMKRLVGFPHSASETHSALAWKRFLHHEPGVFAILQLEHVANLYSPMLDSWIRALKLVRAILTGLVSQRKLWRK